MRSSWIRFVVIIAVVCGSFSSMGCEGDSCQPLRGRPGDKSILNGDPRVGQMICLILSDDKDPATGKFKVSSYHDPFRMYVGRDLKGDWQKVAWKVLNEAEDGLKVEIQVEPSKDLAGAVLLSTPFERITGEQTLSYRHATPIEIEGVLISDIDKYLQADSTNYRFLKFKYHIEIFDASGLSRGRIDPELIVEGRP